MTDPNVDRAVFLAPGITPDERKQLAIAGERVKTGISQNIELREAVLLMALHTIEAQRPPLAAVKFDVPAAEAARQDDYLRGILFGVQLMADCITDTGRINDLLIAIENKDKF